MVLRLRDGWQLHFDNGSMRLDFRFPSTFKRRAIPAQSSKSPESAEYRLESFAWLTNPCMTNLLPSVGKCAQWSPIDRRPFAFRPSITQNSYVSELNRKWCATCSSVPS